MQKKGKSQITEVTKLHDRWVGEWINDVMDLLNHIQTHREYIDDAQYLLLHVNTSRVHRWLYGETSRIF